MADDFFVLGIESSCDDTSVAITNNPKKRAGLEGYGLKIVKNTPMEIKSNCHNDFYLKTKRDKLGHKLFKLNG